MHNTTAPKRQKTSGSSSRPKEETPLSLYKQAVRLVRQQPCGDVTADADVEAKLQKAIQLLQDTTSTQQQTAVTHSLDLELPDEPAFLLASCHLQLGALYQRQDLLDAAEQQHRASLKHFPRFVAALAALGQVLKAAAASHDSLHKAEQLLQQAVDTALWLSQQEDGLLIQSNKACEAELQAADAARAALAMLLCQSGRGAEATPHLQELGFKYRLATEVLHYAIPRPCSTTPDSAHQPKDAQVQHSSGSGSNTTCSFMQAVDSALPPALLQHLQGMFRPGADFWRQHAYGRVGYFSYFFPLAQADTSSMHQLARHLQQLGAQHFPELREAKFAEWWAHCRRHSSGHQLHFDSDDEGQGGVRHPIITAIVYLSDNTAAQPHGHAPDAHKGQEDAAANGGSNSKRVCGSSNAGGCSCCCQQSWVGGPTLMTDQVLGGPLATQGWLAYPSTNRVVFFDGRYLHGVVPGCGPEPSSNGRRCTLMMAFWRELQCRTQPGQGVGACMPLPDPAAATGEGQQHTWQTQLQPLPQEELGTCAAIPVTALQHVPVVWQAVDAEGSSTKGAAYHNCFQGF